MSYAAQSVAETIDPSAIGGGDEYNGKLDPSTADIEVSTADELLNALESSNEVIAIANDVEIDLTGEHQLDLGSKTLVSYRGWNGQEGALLYTNSRGYYGDRPYTLFDSTGSPRVTGLRIRGARSGGGFTRWEYDDNLAQAIRLRGSGGEVDNCELWGWTWNAVHLKGSGENTVTEAEVHHNHIHKSYQLGYGYGINIGRGFGEIHHNYFDETRHAVGGYGWWNSGFVIKNNVFGPRQYSHTVDMHCLEENQATARVGDNLDHRDYDLRAGGEMRIRTNTFCMDQGVHDGGINAVAIRGVPWEGVWIENNRFAHSQRPPSNSGNDQEGFAWRQVNLNLSRWSSIPQDDEGYTQNWNATDNQFEAPETSWESNYGAPIDLTAGSSGDSTEEGPEEGEEQENEKEDADEDENDEQDVLTINGQGSTVYYTFSVDGNVEKSEADGATISDSDTIVPYENFDTIVTGRTTNESDSFALNGEITSFSTSSTGGPAEISIDGETTNPDNFDETVITVVGQGAMAEYEFEFRVDGDVEKSEQYGATINTYDQINGSTVTGRTTDQPDSFVFSGALTEFSADEAVDVLFNGESTGIWI